MSAKLQIAYIKKKRYVVFAFKTQNKQTKYKHNKQNKNY